MKKFSYVITSFVFLSTTFTACNNPSVDDTQIDQSVTINSSKKTKNKIKNFGLGLNTKGLEKLNNDEATATNSLLPDKVDLRPGFSPVYHQQFTNACAAFATVGGLGEYLMKKRGVTTSFSPRFLWNMVRKMEKNIDKNVGVFFPDVIKVVDNYGMLPEMDMPFNSELFSNEYDLNATTEDPNNKPLLSDPEADKIIAQMKKDISEVPTSSMIAKAKKFKISQGWVNINSIHAMKKALSKGYPVVFGVNVYESFYEPGAKGIISLPRQGEYNSGGHAIVAVGYDNSKKYLIIRNSWGPNWADKGYAYLPYDFLKKGHAFGGFTAKF